MAREKNSASVNEPEGAARVEVRRILKDGPLPLNVDDAIKHDREHREQMIEHLREIGRQSPIHLHLAEDLPPDGEECQRAFASDYVERELPPSPLRDYIVRILRQPLPHQEWVLYRDGKYMRDDTISWAVEAAAGFLKTTRNRAARDRDGMHSACSLVSDELRKFGIRLSEDAIEKIYKDCRSGRMRASASKRRRLSEK